MQSRSPMSTDAPIDETAPAAGPVGGFVATNPQATSQYAATTASAAGDSALPVPNAAVVGDSTFYSDPRESASADDQSGLLDVGVWVRESPPWLASVVLHMLALIVLGLFFGGVSFERPLALEARYSDSPGEQLIDDSLTLDAAADFESEQDLLSPTLLPLADDPLETPELSPIAPTGTLLAGDQSSAKVAVALRGRSGPLKKTLGRIYGSTPATDNAIAAGLEWLKKNQARKSGLWSLQRPYSNGARAENHAAATAMALLAFQGDGHTHDQPDSRPYAKTVRDGWNALLELQQEDGRFFDRDNFNHAIYTQAQCTIAVCELLAMTGDETLRDPAQRAVDFLVRAQSENGGWRYQPREGGDLSVTGWVVMALQSARIAGLEVPSRVFFDATRFIDSCERDGGAQYSYLPRGGARPSMTAEGLLCRQYLGWGQEDERLIRGSYYLLQHLPKWERGRRNLYLWYYATQVLHHMEGDFWTTWNNQMRDVLPSHQVASGKERGSWDPVADERHGRDGGRLYTTCLSLYILEVYYRHLPIYRQELIGNL